METSDLEPSPRAALDLEELWADGDGRRSALVVLLVGFDAGVRLFGPQNAARLRRSALGWLAKAIAPLDDQPVVLSPELTVIPIRSVDPEGEESLATAAFLSLCERRDAGGVPGQYWLQVAVAIITVAESLPPEAASRLITEFAASPPELIPPQGLLCRLDAGEGERPGPVRIIPLATAL